MRRDLARLRRAARRGGWEVRSTRGGHWRLHHPSGTTVYASSTPSCPRALANLTADLRRVERRETQP